MIFFGTKTKNKTKVKIHFGRKRKKPKMTKESIFGAENENKFRSASSLMAWPEWPWPLRFYDRSTPLSTIQERVYRQTSTALMNGNSGWFTSGAILTMKKKKKKNLFITNRHTHQTSDQYMLVMGCRKSNSHLCRPPMLQIIMNIR